MGKPPKESYAEVKQHFETYGGPEQFVREYYKEKSSGKEIINKFDVHFLSVSFIIFLISSILLKFYQSMDMSVWTLFFVPFILAIFLILSGYWNGGFDISYASIITRFPLKTKEFGLYIISIYAQIIFFNFSSLKEIYSSLVPSSEILVYIFFPFIGLVYGTMLGTTIKEFIPSELRLDINRIHLSMFNHNKKVKDILDITIQQIESLLQTSMNFSQSFKDTDVYNIGKRYEVCLNIKENVLGLCVLKRKGRYLVRDKDCDNLQNNIEFILEDTLKFEKPEESKIYVDINNEVLDALLDYTKQSEFYRFAKDNWKGGLMVVGGSIILYKFVFV